MPKMLKYRQAVFSASYGTLKQVPPSVWPEISFVGRSNVGKSSLMNKLFGRKNLVKVSSIPGKTSTINFFTVESTTAQENQGDSGNVYFVDLPGYGYAKVAKSEKGRWSELVEGYFTQERRFALVISLIDIRHPLSKHDQNMVSFLTEKELPFVVVFTKADKLSRAQQNKQVAQLCKELAAINTDIVALACSSVSGQGIEDIRLLIQDALVQEAVRSSL